MLDRQPIIGPACELIDKLKAKGALICASQLEAALEDFRASKTAGNYDAVHNLMVKFAS